MKAFAFDRHLVDCYEEFSRSFSTIRPPDLSEAITQKYEEGYFWPDALLSLNPYYEAGPTAEDLVHSGDLCPETAQVFRSGSESIEFYRHQGQAIAKACAGQSFVVTTERDPESLFAFLFRSSMPSFEQEKLVMRQGHGRSSFIR